MRKNQKHDEQKVNELSLKTDSEMMESAKMEPCKDSEKAINEVDYPPELAEFLGEVLKSLHQTMGIPKGENIPTKDLKEFYAKLLNGYDAEKLAYELGCEKLFGLKPKKGIRKLPLIEEEPDAEDDSNDEDDDSLLTDEMLADIDWSTLPEDKYGNRVLAKFALEASTVRPIGVIEQIIQVRIDEDTIENHVVVIVDIPFFDRVPIEEAATNPKYVNEGAIFVMNQTEAFRICPETNDELSGLLDACGISDGRLVFGPGDDIMQEVEETFEDGNVANGDIGVRNNGYYEDTMEYWYGGEIYHEKDVIWFGLPKAMYKTADGSDGVVANTDCFSDLYTSCDILQAKKVKVKDNRRVLTDEEEFEVETYGKKREFFEQLLESEEVWYLASEYAKQQRTYGFCAVCLNGKFNVPVESFYNPYTGACDNLAVMFNVISCMPMHHQMLAILVADVGNIQLQTAFRYQKGAVFDWHKRFNQELAVYWLKNPDFDPFADPYDDPNNAFESGE